MKRRCPARRSVALSRRDMQFCMFHQIEVHETDEKWLRCELGFRHKGRHYAETEHTRYWWERGTPAGSGRAVR